MSITTPQSSWPTSIIKAIVNEDKSTILCKALKPFYLILPIYNVDVDRGIIEEKIFEDYTIITSENFHKNYLNFLHDFNNLLFEDIRPPKVGRCITRPEAKYIIIKEAKLENVFSREQEIKNQELINYEINQIELLITAMRLYRSGSIHINKIYFLSDASFYTQNTKVSTTLYDINRHYILNKEFYSYDTYKIDSTSIQQIAEIIEKLKKMQNRFWLPLSYFNQYYASYDIIEKLIKLSIIWESTILSDKKDELRYTLSMRGSFLLGKNIGEVLKIAYDLRSSIVHTGDINSTLVKKIKKILQNDYSDFGILFYFIKDHLEQITRDILNSFLSKLQNNKEPIEKIATKIDAEIFDKFK